MIDRVKEGNGQTRGKVTFIVTPVIIPPLPSCFIGFCHNNGLCRLVDGRRFCDCSSTMFFGERCDESEFLNYSPCDGMRHLMNRE